jgi:tetratricopeptide (TPR) repeat protein
MQVEIDGLKQKIKEAQNRLVVANKEKSGLLEELNNFRAAEEEVRKKSDSLTKANDKNFIRQQKEAEKERLRQEKAQREQEVRLAKASGKKEIVGLQQKITKLNQANSRLETELNTAKSQLTEFDKTKKELQQADKKNQALSQYSDKQKAEIAKLKSDFTALSRLYDQLQAKAEDLYLQAEDASRVPSLEKAIGSLTKERKLLKEQIARQQSQIAAFNMVKAGLMRDVASAYMQGKIFDLAINYYDNSLKLDPRSADAHYKLGLIYKYSRDNNKKALYHFKKYLELTPNAKNRKEVEYLVDMLSQPEIR